MICPKCGARLAQGSTVCPICGTKIRPSKPVKTKPDHEESYKSSYKDSDYESEEYEDDGYEDSYEDGYDGDDYDERDYDDDDYEPAPKKTNRILVVVIVTVLALIAVMAVMIVLLLNSGNKNNKQIPFTVEKVTESDAAETTAEETTTAVVEIQENRVTSGKNVYNLEDGELKLVEYNDQGQVVRIPEEIGGYKVTAIGSNAFKNNSAVQYLKLPKSMKTLDDYALYDIELLKEVVMPESIDSIGKQAVKNVEKAICVKGSYAWSYMKYMADEVVEGDSLSLDGNTVIQTSQYQTSPPPVSPSSAPSAAPTTAAPVPTTAAPTPTTAVQPSDTPTQPSDAPTQPSDAPTQPSDAPTQPSDAPTQPSDEPTEPSDVPTQPSDVPTTEPEPTTPPEPVTERNAENILAKITSDSGGTVVANSYLYYDFNGNGVPEAFALVDVAGRKEIWFNGEDSVSSATEIFPITDVASCSVNAIQNGATQFVLSVTTSAGDVYSCIYGSTGTSGYMVADLLPGVLVSDGISLQLDNGAGGVAYLLASDGSYSEYSASEISRQQFDAMPGSADIWAQVSALIGTEPANLRFWNRSSAVGNLIQIAFTDASGAENYMNVSWTDSGMQFENGSMTVRSGTVKSSYTGLPQIAPQEIPQIETEAQPSATEISLAEGTSVTLSSEGTSYTADFDGDGAGDFFIYRTQVADDGMTSSLVVNMNGTDYTVGSGSNATYKVEVCDLNTADGKLNLVVVGTGADSSVTSFQVLNGTDLSSPIMKNGSFSVINGYGSAEYLYNTAHVLTPASSAGVFNEEGGFTLAVTSPITIDSLGRYVCKVPYELKEGIAAEDAYSLTTGNYEYDLLDLTSLEQFNYLLAADTNLLSSAAADAPAAAVLPTGTQVFPRKLILSGTETGVFYLYVEDASGNAGYLPLISGQGLFQSVPQ